MVLLILISDVLNAGSKILDLGEVEVNTEKVGVLEKTCSSLHGICGILDCGSSKAANLFIRSAKSIGYGFMFIRLSKNFFFLRIYQRNHDT